MILVFNKEIILKFNIKHSNIKIKYKPLYRIYKY